MSGKEDKNIKIDMHMRSFTLYYHSLFIQKAIHACELSKGAAKEDDLDQEMAYCIDTVIYSCAFLEAAVNALLELLSDPEEGIHEFEKYKAFLTRINKLKGGEFIDRLDIVEKIEFILSLLEKDGIDWSIEPSQSIRPLIRLRNNLMHSRVFCGRLDVDGIMKIKERDSKLKNVLRGKFEFYAYEENTLAPFYYQILNHHCSEWCIRTAIEFWAIMIDKLDVGIGKETSHALFSKPSYEFEGFYPRVRVVGTITRDPYVDDE